MFLVKRLMDELSHQSCNRPFNDSSYSVLENLFLCQASCATGSSQKGELSQAATLQIPDDLVLSRRSNNVMDSRRFFVGDDLRPISAVLSGFVIGGTDERHFCRWQLEMRKYCSGEGMPCDDIRSVVTTQVCCRMAPWTPPTSSWMH